MNPAIPNTPRHTPRRWLAMILVAGLAFAGFVLAERVARKASPTSALAGQSNLRTTFYGQAVNETGAPLPGVNFKFVVEAYPADWTFETRGRDYERSTVTTVSDANGRFQFELNGCVIRLLDARAAGHRELFELDGGTRSVDGGNSGYTRAISLISWSDQQYRSDPTRPAVFVFVSDGALSATTLPSQGGFRSYGPKRWIENRPTWPYRPSLDDVDWADGSPRKNVDVTLVFKTVDTLGRPMGNVNIPFDVERFRSLEEMRKDGYDKTSRTKSDRLLVTTGADGYARRTVTGFRMKSLYNVQVQGKGWGEGPSPIVDRRSTLYDRDFVDRHGAVIFKCDDESPIVLVMADQSEPITFALPSRGGYERAGEGSPWQRVEPAWPEDVARNIRRER